MKLRWQERLEFYQKALQSLKTALYRFDKLSDLEQDGAVLRFEFTFELAWKTLQDYFTETGYLDAKGPRNVLKKQPKMILSMMVIAGFKCLKTVMN
ncbi:MAG: nucleotidyltransferase [Spirosoma sp.]|nr:nucleotidyltransferase [Spirosoma sp.]